MALLRLLQLASPALPVGAYAYSQGLEYAVDEQWVENENAMFDWLTGQMENGLAKNDLPIIGCLFYAWQSKKIDEVIYWNDYLRALRETTELEKEDLQMGQALKRLLGDLISENDNLLSTIKESCYATGFSFACAQWEISKNDMLLAYAFSWVENQIAAGIKLIPLGQTAGQRLLQKMMPVIERAVKNSVELDINEIGASLPAVSLASSLHETQYSRLFRS